MLPGTHNSGCYYKGDALARGDTISRFVLTQDEDIWEQLVWGARYLDIRVGYYRDRGSGNIIKYKIINNEKNS
jgi:hypothetical protein